MKRANCISGRHTDELFEGMHWENYAKTIRYLEKLILAQSSLASNLQASNSPLQRLPPVASGARTHLIGEEADIRLPRGPCRAPARRRTANADLECLKRAYRPMCEELIAVGMRPAWLDASEGSLNSAQECLEFASGIACVDASSGHLGERIAGKLSLCGVCFPPAGGAHDRRNVVVVPEGNDDAKPLLNRIGMQVVLDFKLQRLDRPRTVSPRIHIRNRLCIRRDISVVDVDLRPTKRSKVVLIDPVAESASAQNNEGDPRIR